ncbi:HNH endonuclease signature motif containing protein [Nocardioides dubius]|uniref:HNH nuclease domain-containing protein n=1 Tax=Nocardioides dubius TaxID=317019 RepID=A0ABN1U3S3_9ACTN
MSGGQQGKAWLLMTVGDDRQHGGNSGYDDDPDVYYTWDSTVPNHASVARGDAIALWDKKRLLGISVVEDIEETIREKLLFRCPHCHKAGIKERKSKAPRFKCYKCRREFESPIIRPVTVKEYRSRHDAAWTPFEALITGAELRELCESPKSQLSMRLLRWDAFQELLNDRGAGRALERVAHRAPDYFFPQGHRLEVVRVRRGQRPFRDHLLELQGELCALTGEAPARILEAGHLYSYAELGVHHKHGGLLLRRDIHRLFDDGWLAIDPSRHTIDVAESLGRFPQYAWLAGKRVRVRLNDDQVEWIERHWSEHRMR